MINPSNAITLLRGPLALLFLFENPAIRIFAVLGAMATDCIDGWLARKFKITSRIGAMLDPLMDKFFVLFVLIVFLMESKLALWQIFALGSRDIALVIFGGYLFARNRFHSYTFKPVKWGKVSTALQFFILTSLTLGFTVPNVPYFAFLFIGLFVLIEHCIDSSLQAKAC